MRDRVRIAAPIRRRLSEYDPDIVDLVGAFTDSAFSSLRESGADMVVLDADEWADRAAGDFDPEWDGLLLLGGGDLDPALYGDSERHPRLWGINQRVDGVELGLTRGADAAGAPVFGICRGLQVLNVARGGTLHQHLEGTSVTHASLPPEPPMVDHEVRIEPGSRLAEVLGATQALVRTGHHQGVRQVGERLVPVAWALDGLIEALEDPVTGTLAVQWHPEDPAAPREPMMRLARHFVALAAHRRSRSPTRRA
ncbi:MAG: gamma-glutamyl-gamma-aminobutyrate hydrolase family protein [Clostridia bacterium]